MTGDAGGHGAPRVAFGITLALAILLVAAVFYPLWQPLLVAAVLAGTTHGWYRKLTAALGARVKLAATLMTVAVVALILIPVGVVAAVAIREGFQAYEYLRAVIETGGIDGLIRRLPDAIEEPIRQAVPTVTEEDVSRQAAEGGWTVARFAGDVLTGAGRILIALVFTVIGYFALLVEGPRLVAWVEGASPLPGRQASELIIEFRRVSRSVLGSTLASAAAQSAVASVGYAIAGVPNVVFFALLTGLASFLPAVGTQIVSLPLAVILLVTGNLWQGIFLLAYAAFVISLVDNIVKPLVIRGGMQLPSVLIFFALIGGLFAFGPIGLIVGPLAVTFFLAMVRFARREDEIAPAEIGDAPPDDGEPGVGDAPATGDGGRKRDRERDDATS